MGYWSGKSAIVTGGSSGLGLSIADALVNAGANVAIVGRSVDKLEVAAGTLRARGKGQVLSVVADITRGDDVEHMVATAVERFGKLDLLVNCAGSSARGTVQSTSLEDFRELMELNFFALVACTLAALPHLLSSHGYVVNIGSLSAKTASRFMGGYAASKFAVAAYSQQLRLELAEQGLHVLLVCPGPIARPETRDYPGSENVPDAARMPAAGAKIKRIDPDWLAQRILAACERGQSELIVPWQARLVFAVSQLSPSLGDWLVRKMTS